MQMMTTTTYVEDHNRHNDDGYDYGEDDGFDNACDDDDDDNDDNNNNDDNGDNGVSMYRNRPTP